MLRPPRLRHLIASGIAFAATLVGAAPASASTASGPVAAPNGVAGTDRVVTLTVGNVDRAYRLFVPTTLNATSARLIIALHPLNGTAAGFESLSNLDAGAASTGDLVAYPAGISGSWNAGRCCGTAQATGVDDVGFIDALIDDVTSRYSIDSARTTMGGFSNGALMTYRYLCERSARVRFGFIGSGADVAPTCSFTRPVQVLHMHGMKDTTVPWYGTTTSPYTTDGVMPSVSVTTNTIAAADGCSTKWVGSAVNSLLNKYVPASCPAGAGITVYQSSTLTHAWVTGSTAASTYGINETSAVWSWLTAVWKS